MAAWRPLHREIERRWLPRPGHDLETEVSLPATMREGRLGISPDGAAAAELVANRATVKALTFTG